MWYNKYNKYKTIAQEAQEVQEICTRCTRGKNNKYKRYNKVAHEVQQVKIRPFFFSPICAVGERGAEIKIHRSRMNCGVFLFGML